MDNNLEAQLRAIGEMGKGAYEAGYKKGFEDGKKEAILERDEIERKEAEKEEAQLEQLKEE